MFFCSYHGWIRVWRPSWEYELGIFWWQTTFPEFSTSEKIELCLSRILLCVWTTRPQKAAYPPSPRRILKQKRCYLVVSVSVPAIQKKRYRIVVPLRHSNFSCHTGQPVLFRINCFNRMAEKRLRKITVKVKGWNKCRRRRLNQSRNQPQKEIGGTGLPRGQHSQNPNEILDRSVATG